MRDDGDQLTSAGSLRLEGSRSGLAGEIMKLIRTEKERCPRIKNPKFWTPATSLCPTCPCLWPQGLHGEQQLRWQSEPGLRGAVSG